MKKFLLTFMALAMFAINVAYAVNVKVEMSTTSPTMTLTDKVTGNAVDIGEPANRVYTFDAPTGAYVLTAYGTNGTTVNGTIVINVTDEADQEFKVLTNTIYATNSNWQVDTDYTIEVTVCTREGVKQEITIGNSTTAGRKTFLALNGNSYIAALIPSEAHQAEDYMTLYKQGTLTNGVTVSGAIPQGTDYTVTVPADAEFFMGMKMTHYIAFTKIEPKAVENEGDSKKLTYRLANGQVYNYRTWKSGGLTQGGYFTMNADETKRPTLVFTNTDYEAFGAKTIKHDVQWNGGYETGDIFVNINERGHLKLNVGDTFDALAMRTWQLTDNSTNNYFIEPDFHYTVIGVDGTPSNDVITIEQAAADPWATIKAIGNGTAIVLVTYDAIGLNYYSGTNKSPYMGGEYWSAIWPENTAAYVVTVGGGATAIDPNMTINEGYNEDTKKVAGQYVDAEHDVFYYLDTEEGFAYTFKPTGVENVELAYPTIGEQMATYTGFGTTGVTKNEEDGSYTVLLKEGRQIVRLTDAAGNAVYQVLTAKKCHRDITNVTRKGSKTFIPGDQVKIQYSGLRHPANKLAGIHNFSAYVTYNGVPNGTSLILGSGQYTFGSAPSAQNVTVTIPNDGSTELVMNEGVLQVTGYGDPIGNHRKTNRITGRAPNFTAIAHKTYFGAIPEVRLPISEAKQFIIRLLCEQEGVNYTLTRNGEAVTLNDDGTYTGTYGDYALTASKNGYRCYRHIYTIADEAEGEQTFNVVLTPADVATWDGQTETEPAAVEDVYQIGTGAELAWFAAKVNGGQYKTKAVLTADIDLGDFAWTPIGGTTTAKAYQGIFDGKGHTVSGLYINNEATNYQGLFAYLKDATVSGVTVEGEITGKQYVGGIAANMGANAIIDRCVNKAKITGVGTYVGGITGYVGVATAKVTNSYNLGDVTGTTNCGGVAGSNNATAVIENIFNLGNVEGTTVGACVGGTTKKDNVKKAFATVEYGITTGQTTVTDEQMKSGYVARLLGEAFGQTLGTDNYPVLDGKKVYQVYYTTSLSDAAEVFSLYTNGTLPELQPVSGLYPTWLTAVDGEPVSEVTADATLYVNYAPVVIDEKIADFEDIEIGEEGHMSVSTEEDDERTDFTSGTYKFYTGCMSDWDYWYWFGYANEKTNTFESLADQWKNAVGGGYDNSNNYGVAYAAAFNGPCYVDVMHNSTGAVVPGFYITNSAYAYSSMLNGDGYAKKFEKGDWFKLTVTGYDVDGNETGTKDYYLADLRDPSKAFIINDWRYVDLSGLGKVSKLGFELTSSDGDDWGMKTPAYFCFDNFGAEGEEVLPEKNVEFPLEVATFEEIEIGAEGHMSVTTEEDDERTEFTSGDFEFASGCMHDWDYWYWFGYANRTKTAYETLDDQWNNVVGGGYDNSANYGVAYAAAFNGPCNVTILNHNDGIVVPGFYITNSSYAYSSMTNGDGFAKKFGKGDWFKLTITGYDAAGEVTGTKDFYLADLRDPSKAYIINDWRYVDLSGLGKVNKLGFELSSTDNGTYGMNTPAYFCFDNFGAAGEEVLPEKNVILPMEIATFEDVDVENESFSKGESGYTTLTSGSYQFDVYCDDTYGTPYYYAFCAANYTGNTYDNDYNGLKNVVGGGYNGSNNYGAYFANYYGQNAVTVLSDDSEGAVVPGFYITNSAYAYSSMTNGDSYAKKFGKDDWFKLSITGYDAAGEETGTKEYYLADLRDEAKAYIINDWRYVDLSGLGKVKKLTFALSSTDNGDWGMNTPAYFCFDNFGAEGTEILPEKNVEIETAISNISAAKQSASYYNLKGENMPTLQKGVNIIRMSDGSVRKVIVK